MTAGTDTNWLFDDLVSRVPDIEKALLLTRDGLTVAASQTLGREDAERLAAIASAFHSLARGAVQQLGAQQAHQVIVEMDTAFLFVTEAGEGSCLAVVASGGADVGLVAYEMTLLVKRFNEHLAAHPRSVPHGGKVT
jgi:predicted regulator of Ras-like GTPase activity (Roadblock/LC7/MglB family)